MKRLANTQFRLTVPSFSLPAKLDPRYTKPWLVLLNYIEFIAFLALPVVIFWETSPIITATNWIAALLVIIAIRLIRMLFVGLNAFPPVKYDLPFLLLSTAILVLTILQGKPSYTNLGGVYFWGIGMTLISIATIYFIHQLSSLYLSPKKYLAWAAIVYFALTVLKFLVGTYSPSNLGILSESILLNNVIVLMGISYVVLFAKNIKIRVMAGIALVILGYLSFGLLKYPVPLLALAVTFVIFGILWVRKQRNLGIICIAAFAAIIAFMLLTEAGRGVILSIGVLYSIATATMSTWNLSNALVGTGYTTNITTAMSLVTGYGIIGTLIGALVLGYIVKDAATLIKRKQNHTNTLVVFMLAYILFSMLLLPLMPMNLFFGCCLIATVFQLRGSSLNNNEAEVQLNIYGLAKLPVVKKMLSENTVKDIIDALRLVVVAAIIVFLPAVIRYLQDIL